MKKDLLIFLLFFSLSFKLIAQNDTTNDSWLSNNNGVSTTEPVSVDNDITFSHTTAIRGIRRHNRAFSLGLTGGDSLSTGASIMLSGDYRGGINSPNRGRMDFWTGGAVNTTQANLTGHYYFNTQWQGSSKTLMTLRSNNGRLGLGTTNPTAFLHIKGPSSGYNPGESALKIEGNYNTYAASVINNFGGNNAGGLLIETTDGNGLTNALKIVTFRTITPQIPLRIPNGSRNQVFLVEEGGRVGIGTTTPENALDVCGFIRSEEVIVEDEWCDFVFDKEYQLPTLLAQKIFIEKMDT